MAGSFFGRGTLRRMRRMELSVTRRLSFESLTFFGAVAVVVGAMFNIGLLAEFGLSFISMLAVDELVMTSFGLLVFLVPFYAISVALVSQATLVRDLGRVVRRAPRMRSEFVRALAIALFEAALIAGLVAAFVWYRGSGIGFGRIAVLVAILIVSVVLLSLIGLGSDRSRLWLTGLQLTSLCAASVFFGLIVAEVRQSRQSEIMIEGGTIKGGIVLMSKAGVFLRTREENGARRSLFIPASGVRRILD